MHPACPLVSLCLPTPDGEFIAHYSSLGLAELNFPTRNTRFRPTASGEFIPQIAAWHRLTAAAVKNLLAGHGAGQLPPLDLDAGTDFQRAVWRAMLQIGCGQTKSYGEIAQAIGRPKAVRAVGAACGANPIPLLVPCHRVVAAGGKLGGYSGGLEWKRELLTREGVTLV